MPQLWISSQNSPDLAIILDKGTNATFQGRETISGCIIRKSHYVDPNPSVTVRLYGRVKSKMSSRKGSSSSSSSGRASYSHFQLFDSTKQAPRRIHQGPVHVQPNSDEGQKWPFAIPLPEQHDISDSLMENTRGFPPVEKALPPSFYGQVCVIAFLAKGNPPIPIAEFEIKHRSDLTQKVDSPRLIPGMQDTRIFFGQRFKKWYGSTEIPGYLFSMQRDFASRLQMGNPHPIPMRLRAMPLWNDTSEIIQGVPQAIQIQRSSVSLLSTTYFTIKNSREHMLQGKSSSFILKDYMYIHSKAPSSTSKVHVDGSTPQDAPPPPPVDVLLIPQDNASPPLDFGTALGIRIPRGRLYSSFTTYNVKHLHHLEWRLILTLAGETVKYEGRQPVTLLGPCHG